MFSYLIKPQYFKGNYSCHFLNNHKHNHKLPEGRGIPSVAHEIKGSEGVGLDFGKVIGINWLTLDLALRVNRTVCEILCEST